MILLLWNEDPVFPFRVLIGFRVFYSISILKSPVLRVRWAEFRFVVMEITQYQEPPSNKEGDPALGFLTRKETEVKLPRPTRVKNKTPAPVQITAEQILREARERQEAEIRPPKQKITDAEELAEYRLRKRKEYEDLIRRVRWNTSVWVKYAQWEESQRDFARARSIWERAIEVDYTNSTLWLKYSEMEMKNKFVNHARNVWDRAVSLLPRIDQLWYKYIHMEEMLGNLPGARQIFERWMTWEPDHHGWAAYIKFELRYNEIDRARSIYDRFCSLRLLTYSRVQMLQLICLGFRIHSIS